MSRTIALSVIAACFLGFAAIFLHLLLERIEAGNVYPAGSSLRSDPIGSLILWESLSAVPGLTVERDHSAIGRLPNGKNTTYLHLGGSASAWTAPSPEDTAAIERFLLEGGRVVITLHPNTGWLLEDKQVEKDQPAPGASPTPDPEPSRPPKRPALKSAAAERWKLPLGTLPTPSQKTDAKRFADLPLPQTLPWHGNIILKDPGPSWRIVYERAGAPVVAEIARGPGSLVVLTDSYLLSNEALVRDRQPALISWLIGPSTRVVFDETHHGIVESPGLAAMARQYGLTGAACALLAWAGLFVWKTMARLAPRRATRPDPDAPVTGRSSFDGFLAMLRRTIPPGEIFAQCWHAWKSSFGRSRRFSPERKVAAEAYVAALASGHDPQESSRRLHEILHSTTT